MGIWIACLLAVIALPAQAAPFAPGQKHALYISSYHPAFPVVPQQIQGILSTFSPAGVDLDMEFMDTKRFGSPLEQRMFTELLKHKLARLPAYDVVVTCDDNALQFALDQGQMLFPSTPVVFCGVNNKELAYRQNDSNLVTGVVEELSIRESLTAVRRMLPGVERVVVVSDATPTGLASMEAMRQAMPSLPEFSFSELRLGELTFEELGQSLHNMELGPKDVILILSLWMDAKGDRLDFPDSFSFIKNNVSVPIMFPWEFGIGSGVLGGKIVDHAAQGRKAAELALRVLQGESPADIPVVPGDDANQYVFDYKQLQRLGIPLSRLPEDSRIINEPVSALHQNRFLVLLGLGTIFLLLLIIGALAKSNAARRRAARVQGERKEYFQQFFDNAPLPYQSLNEKGYFLAVNRIWLSATGYTEDEVLGGWFGDFLHPDDKRLFDARFPMFKNVCSIDGAEFRLRKKDDSYIQTNFIGRVQLDDSGNFVRTHCVFMDVTKSKQAEMELVSSEQQFRTIFDNSLTGIALLKGGRVLARCNHRLAEILGYDSPDELDGQPARFIHMTDESYETFGRLYYGQLAYGRKTNIEFEMRHKSGHPVWCLLSGKVIDDTPPVDVSKGVIWTIADISERKRMEEQLILARDEAEAASLAKSMFLANMSHEIRTPLNGMLGMLQLLQQSPENAARDTFLEAAVQSGKRLSSLLSDILDLTKIEANKVALREQNFHPAETLDSVRDLLGPTAASAGLELTIDIAPNLPPLLSGDENRLQQILFNLVGNAIKFTPKGGVAVEAIPLPPRRPGQANVLFTIRDTGIGMSPDLLNHIFESFAQVEESYVRQFQGAGLGLAIVKRLVNLMDGSICVDSTPGQGSTFYLSLPLGLPQQPEDAPPLQDPAGVPQSAPVDSAPADGGLAGKSILLVEDEQVSQSVIAHLLQTQGCTVRTADNGRQALDQLRQHAFDCVLMDVQMPVMDGLEATRIIRKDPEFAARSGVPIVALTAYAMPEDEDNFLTAGMDAYISKPVDLSRLQAMLVKLLNERSAFG